VLSVNKTKRETVASGVIGIANQNANFGNNQTGYSASWNSQFSAFTNLGLSANYNKADGGFRSNTKTYRATVSRKLQPKVNANLEVRHVQQDSNYLLGNYKENAITLYFFLGF